MFIGAVRKFLDMEAITAPLVHELIDHIDVYEAEGKGKNKTQRVVIHYNFVGYLEIPENDEPCFTADTRQGVAIAGVILAFVMTMELIQMVADKNNMHGDVDTWMFFKPNLPPVRAKAIVVGLRLRT